MDSEDDMAYEDEYDNPDEDEDSSRFRAQRGDKHEEEVRQDQEDHIEVDDDDIDDGRNSDAGGPTCPRIYTPDSGDYDVLSPEQVCQYMNEVVKEVSHIFELPATTTRLLLNHFHWDKECLMERFYEDEEKLFKDAHVMRPSAGSKQASTVKSECNICFMTLKGTEFKGTDCGHRFCTTCWRSYLVGKIVDENVTDKIECPAHNCRILVDDGFVMEMVGSQVNVRRKYQHGITNSFVEAHRIMRWCPGTDCLYAIRLRVSPDWMSVTCTQCQTAFCFLCGDQWHDPATCAVLKRWKKKCADDSETSNWISANTKECPTCHATIEKDGGCNHVVCKNSACKAEFCWICLGPWQPHGSSWFKCNRYTEDDAKAARDNQEKSRYALQRYLFYFNRYVNHQQSLRLETKLNNSIRNKMEELQQHNMSWIEVQFLKKAVDVLQLCRQTLMYTYVFAFYLQKNNQQILFEDNQHDLENATETLSGFLERDITGQNVAEIKQRVQDKAAYCQLRRNALVKHVHEGYEKDWWDFSL